MDPFRVNILVWSLANVSKFCIQRCTVNPAHFLTRNDSIWFVDSINVVIILILCDILFFQTSLLIRQIDIPTLLTPACFLIASSKIGFLNELLVVQWFKCPTVVWNRESSLFASC